MRVIIAGSRDFYDYEKLKNTVDGYLQNVDSLTPVIISGTARGADRLGEKYAIEHSYEVRRFPANWDKYGKSAGYIRNREMAQYAIANESVGVLISFWDGKSRGTKYMIELAKEYGLRVIVVNF